MISLKDFEGPKQASGVDQQYIAPRQGFSMKKRIVSLEVDFMQQHKYLRKTTKLLQWKTS